MIVWIFTPLLLLLTSFYLLHKYISKNYDYWEKRKVPFIKPKPFVGNMLDLLLMKCDLGTFFADLYNQTDAPFFGIFVFAKPFLCVKDVNFLKHIFVEDFDNFVDRHVFSNKDDPVTAHALFLEKGDDWRLIRSKISPFFSRSHLRSMVKSMDDKALNIPRYLKKYDDQENIDVRELASRYTVDVVILTSFGVDIDSFEDPEFHNTVLKLFDKDFSVFISFFSYFFCHIFAKIFKLRFFKPEVLNFTRKFLWDLIEKREKLGIQRNDVIDIITDLRKDSEFCAKMNFEGDKVISQPFAFIAGGFETTSATIAFALYELCIAPDVLKKTRDGIRNTIKKFQGEITFESVSEIKYLNMVIKETLRKYPLLPFLDRVVNKDYQIPGTDVILEKGTDILLPLFGLHYDSNYFPEPDKFIPERFEDDEPGFIYLPFGKGPRSCIGERFGLLMIRIAMVRILNEYEVQRTEATPVPLVYDAKALVIASEGGLQMKFKRTEPLF